MQELEVTWGRALNVMWLILWRGMLGAIILGTVIGFVIGFAFGLSNAALNAGAQMNPFFVAIPSAAAGIFWYLVVVRMALRKQYNDFRMALVPRST